MRLAASNMSWEARSNRLMHEHVDMAALGEKALQQACTFVSCCKVHTTAEDLKKGLAEWWSETGQDLLFGTVLQDSDLQESFSDDEEDEEPIPADPSVLETKSLQENVDAAQKTALVEAELADLQGGETNVTVEPDQFPGDDCNVVPDSDDEQEDPFTKLFHVVTLR